VAATWAVDMRHHCLADSVSIHCMIHLLHLYWSWSLFAVCVT